MIPTMPRAASSPTPPKPLTASPVPDGDTDGASPKRAFEQVAREIRARIGDGRLKAGDRLQAERDLADHFKVSRNTVREAVRSLENAGLLVLRRGPGGGAFVASGYGGTMRTGMSDLISLGLIKPENLSEARTIIGVAVARRAAERRTYGDLEALQFNMAETDAAVKADDIPRWIRLSFEFHRLLARATQNPALVVLMDAVIELNDQMVKAAGLRDPRKAATFRRKIFKQLEARDANGAAAEMEQYLEMLGRFYQTKLGS
jgi:GntR family transcriptional repressor for pyruvate dehydrogenase complex